MQAHDFEEELAHALAYFVEWVAAHGSQGAVGEVASWLTAPDLDVRDFHAIERRHGAIREEWFRRGMADLVLGYAAHRITCGPFDALSAAAISLLRRLLHVSGEELLRYRARELATLLTAECARVLDDGQLTDAEDAYLVELQAAFDLSFDQYLALIRPALQQAVPVTGDTSLRRRTTLDTLHDLADR